MRIIRPRGLAAQERRAAQALRAAFQVARNRHLISHIDRGLVSASRANELCAANPYARDLGGTALWSAFASRLGLSASNLESNVPLFWVTLADLSCATSITASNVDARACINHLRKGLRGLSYLGVLDAGLYANIQSGTEFLGRSCVSWHLHLIVWGASSSEIKKRFKKLNRLSDNYRPIIPRPQGLGADWSAMTSENLERRFRYMLKTPSKAYRVGRKDVVDSKGNTSVRFIHSRSKLRPGQRISLFQLLKNLDLAAITVAAGEGRAIRQKALRCILGR